MSNITIDVFVMQIGAGYSIIMPNNILWYKDSWEGLGGIREDPMQRFLGYSNYQLGSIHNVSSEGRGGGVKMRGGL